MHHYFDTLSRLALIVPMAMAGCSSSSSDSTPTDPSNHPGDDDDGNGDTTPPSDDDVPTTGLDFTHLWELADFPIGMAVSAGAESRSLLRAGERAEAERAVVNRHFSQLTPGNIMKMSYLHDNWGQYTFDHADALTDYALDNGMTVHGHALAWHSCYQIPEWVWDYQGTPETFLADLSTHVETIAAHFSGKVVSWDVVNEAFHDSGEYRGATEDCSVDGEDSMLNHHANGPTHIETAFVAARHGDPTADLYYNDFNLSPNGPKLAAVLEMVDDFQERNIPIDGIGFQMHIQMDWPSVSDIRASFAAVLERDLKVKITELDIPINNPFSGEPTHDTFSEAAAQAQKRRYCEVIEAYLDVVPEDKRGGVSIWGLVDGESWLIDQFFEGEQAWPLLFTDDLEPKPALIGVADALRGRPCF